MIDSEAARGRQSSPGRVVAVTGVCHYLGTELVKRLEEDPRYSRILALDIRKPEIPLEKTAFIEVDLTVPTVDRHLARILAAEGVDTVVHGAFLSQPTHATEWAHELEDVGTMHVLNACAEARPARFIMQSSTMVYGASPQNPGFLTEGARLRGHTDSRFVQDKVRAERQARSFARQHPATKVCVLRFAPILGPTVDNFFTRFFSRPVAPVMMGYDPLLQFLHEIDAVRALEKAVATEVQGPFNIVGKRVLPYTTVLALMGRVPVVMPHMVARTLSKALWMTQVFDSPPSFLDFLRYPCVADGSRARRELGFSARYSIKHTVLDFLGVAAEDGTPDIDRMFG